MAIGTLVTLGTKFGANQKKTIVLLKDEIEMLNKIEDRPHFIIVICSVLFWLKRVKYSRVDFFLATSAMQERIMAGRGKVADFPEARVASDHRMVYLDLLFKAPAGE